MKLLRWIGSALASASTLAATEYVPAAVTLELARRERRAT
jgi:hypothetical protein